MVPLGMVSEYSSDMLYDSGTQSLIFIGRDQNTIRRMSLDGPDRSIIFKPGIPLLGGFSFHSKSGVVFYLTKSVRLTKKKWTLLRGVRLGHKPTQIDFRDLLNFRSLIGLEHIYVFKYFPVTPPQTSPTPC